jgi:YbbR domain-containing protein
MKSSSFQKWTSPSRWFQRLRHINIENKGLKLISLVLALLLFAISRQPTTNVRLSGVPLEFRGLAQGIEISSDVQPTVSVLLRGPRDIVRSVTPNQLSVVANLGNKEPGERIVQLRPEDVSPIDNIKVLKVEPANIRLMLEPIISKRVTVEPQFMGRVAEGFEIYKVALEPVNIEISGPQSQINKVHQVLTETVNLNGKNNNFRVAVDIETPHNSIRANSPASVTLSIEIGERRVTRRLAKVPIESDDRNITDRLIIKTVDVDLYGPRSAVENLQPGDLRVELINVGPPAETETLKPQVRLPADADKHIEVKKIFPSEVRLKRR